MSSMKAGVLRKLFSVAMVFVMVIGTMLPAVASDGGWSSVIRPGVQGGTGTADYSVEIFTPLYQTNSSMIFFAPRFRVNPGLDDENEFNVGLGYRRLIMNDEWFVGGNVFYDTMESRNGFRYHQVGLGLEGRSKWIDAFLNGYVQVGDDMHRIENNDLFSLGSTQLLRRNGEEQALSGMDGEVGVLIPYVSNYVETRAYAGGYWYSSDISSDVAGVKGRVQINPVPLVTINGTYIWDDKFQSVWRADAYLNIPFSFTNIVEGKNPFAGFKDALKFGQGPRDARARMTDRVERDRYVRTVEGNDDAAVSVHDMVYVNNANTSGVEDGTLEHPYSTVAGAVSHIQDDTKPLFNPAAPPYIYIFAGKGPYYEGDLTFNGGDLNPDGLSLLVWGQHYTLPGLTGGDYPVIDATEYGNGLYFDGGANGSDFTLRGLEVDNANGSGVYAYNINNANITGNVFNYNGDEGIYLGLTGSTANIYNNTAIGNGEAGIAVSDYDGSTASGTDINIVGNTASDNGERGISVYVDKDNDGDVNILMDGNTANGNGSQGIYAYVDHYGTGLINVVDTNNTTMTNGDDGNEVYIDAYGDNNVSVAASGNTSRDNGDDGIYVYVDHDDEYGAGYGDTAINVTGNHTSNNDGDNIYAGANTDSYGGDIAISVSGNEANNGESDGIDVEAWNYADGGDISLAVTGNTADGNYDDNIYAYAYGDGLNNDVAVNISGNHADDSRDDFGIQNCTYNYGDGATTVNINDNYADGNYYGGIYAYVYADSTNNDMTVNIDGNEANDTKSDYGWWYGWGYYGNGIALYAYNYADGKLDVDISGNIATGNAADGIYSYVQAEGASNAVSVNIAGNDVSENDAYGVELNAYNYGDGKLDVDITGNDAHGNYDSNISAYVEADGSSNDVSVNIADNKAYDSNWEYGIELYAYNYGDGKLDVDITGNDAHGNYYSNIYAYVYGDGSANDVTTNISGNQAYGSYDEYGIETYVYNYGDGKLDVDINNNYADSNYEDNIYAYVYGDGSSNEVTVDVTGNQASNSDEDDGIDLDVYNYGDGATTVNVTGNTANLNSSDGIDAYVYADGTTGGLTGLTVTDTGNVTNHNGSDGNYLDVWNDYGESTADVTVTDTGNTADYNGDTGISAIVTNDGYGATTVDISGNGPTNNYYDNIYFDITHYGDEAATVTIADNTDCNKSQTGFGIGGFLSNFGSGLMTADITGNTAKSNYLGGIGVATYDDNGDIELNITGNDVENNKDHDYYLGSLGLWVPTAGINVLNLNGDNILEVSGNTVKGNEGLGGIALGNIDVYGPVNMDATIDSNTVMDNTYGVSVINIQLSGGSVFTGEMSHNTVTDNYYYGVGLINFAPAANFTMNMGDHLGIVGFNAFYGNIVHDVVNATGTTVEAQDNWWGTGTETTGPTVGPADGTNIYDESGTTNYANWLTSAP